MVDVLKELDRRLEIGALFGQEHGIPAANLTGDETLRQARAAVAELIEASKAAIVLCTEACSHANPAMRQDAILRRDALIAALAACKGESPC